MKNVLLNIVLSLILFSYSNVSLSQARIDSLWDKYYKLKSDTGKVNMLNEQIGYYYEGINPDTAIRYYKLAINIAEKALIKAPKDKRLLQLKASSLKYIGIVSFYSGKNEAAVGYYFSAIEIYQSINDQNGVTDCYIALGSIYYTKSEFDKALSKYNSALKIKQQIKDSLGISRCFTNIGNVFSELGKYKDAIDSYFAALKIKEKLNDIVGQAKCYNNIGHIHYNQESYIKAEEYYKKALEIFKSKNLIQDISDIYISLGFIKNYQKKFDEALALFYESLKLKKTINNRSGITKCLINIAEVYKAMDKKDTSETNSTQNLENASRYLKEALIEANEIGELGDIITIKTIQAEVDFSLYLKFKSINANKSALYLESSRILAHESLLQSQKTNTLPMVQKSSGILMDVYKSLGDYKKSFEYAELYITSNDSLFFKEKTKAVIEAEKKFEAEKKQFQIEKLSKEKELQFSELKRHEAVAGRRKLQIIFAISGLLLISVFSVFITNRLKITRRQKRIIEQQKIEVDEKNEILNNQNEEISAQRDEIEKHRDEIAAQRDLVIEQKKHIEDQKQEITDSINYAQRIQYALLPDIGNSVKSNNSEFKVEGYFLLFKPKDIVSGDFYWLSHVGDFLVFTVADCTGHGVPGAFMSMLGISFLNEIVNKKEISETGQVLDLLRENVIEALQQKGIADEQHDGMDIALCALNKKTLELQFSGANNPVYILSQNNEAEARVQYSLSEIKGNKQPVSYHEKMSPFVTHRVQLSKGDMVFVGSDGIETQFGGAKNKMFSAKKLREILLTNSHKTMDEIYTVLDTTLSEWIIQNPEPEKQTDDITLFGLKL